MKQKKIRLILSICALFFTVFLVSSNSPAAFAGPLYEDKYDQIVSPDLPNREGVKVGNVILHSALRTGVAFDSNIFLADTGEKYDNIITVAPSVGIEVPMQDNRLSVEYEAAMSFFDRHTEQDHLDHKVRGLLGINLTDFKVLLNDAYRRFTNRAGSTEVGTSGTRTREEQNALDLSLGAEFDKLAYRFTYSNKLRNFLSKNEPLFGAMNYDDKNSMAHIGNFEVDYAILPKTTLLLDTTAGKINYHSTLVPDSYFIEIMPGFKYKWGEKLTLDMRLGERYQDYQTSTFMQDGDFFGVVGRASAEYKLTDNDVLGLTSERNVTESIYQDVNYYNTNKVGLDYAHKFSDKVSSDLFFAYQLNRYPTQTTEGTETGYRRDSIYRGGASLRYEPQKWMALDFGYEARHRASSFSTLDYIDHVATVQTTIGF